MPGTVYVASMKMRGAWAPLPEGATRLNVTSVQAKDSPDRLTFSPMTPTPGGYKGYYNFEAYWQAGKVFEGLPHETSRAWWRAVEEPKRRHPQARKHKVLCARFDGIDGDLDYIASRKRVYAPEYYAMVEGTPRLDYWRRLVASGKDVAVYDCDGPKDADGLPTCEVLTPELLNAKIHDVQTPFGHGYVVAAAIAGISPEEYCAE